MVEGEQNPRVDQKLEWDLGTWSGFRAWLLGPRRDQDSLFFLFAAGYFEFHPVNTAGRMTSSNSFQSLCNYANNIARWNVGLLGLSFARVLAYYVMPSGFAAGLPVWWQDFLRNSIHGAAERPPLDVLPYWLFWGFFKSWFAAQFTIRAIMYLYLKLMPRASSLES